MALPTAYYRQLIDAAAAAAALPWWRGFSPGCWLEAVVLQESTGNHKARRYEPHQDAAGRRDAAEDADAPALDDGPLEDDASYGLMQLMGYNARRLVGAPPGTPLRFTFLLDPIVNLGLSLQVLHQELAATRFDVSRALARYNGGPSGDAQQLNGQMRRQVYVDGVAAWAERAKRERGGA